MLRDLGQRGQRADLEAAVHFLDAPQLGHLAQIDDDAGPLGPVLEPVERIEAARHHPGIGPVAIQQAQGVGHRRRLKQLEGRHHVSNDCHISCS